MRHLRHGRKLNRDQGHRKALFRNMAISLLKHERIETTDAKAKELRGVTEKLISLGKKGDLHSRRIAAQKIHDSEKVIVLNFQSLSWLKRVKKLLKQLK